MVRDARRCANWRIGRLLTMRPIEAGIVGWAKVRSTCTAPATRTVKHRAHHHLLTAEARLRGRRRLPTVGTALRCSGGECVRVVRAFCPRYKL